MREISTRRAIAQVSAGGRGGPLLFGGKKAVALGRRGGGGDEPAAMARADTLAIRDT